MPELIQRSFIAGEIAPSLRARVDLNKYQSGLALCENFFVRAQGGVYSRPGTRFIDEQGDSTKRARLIPFSFNTEQTYILVFEDLKLRFIKDGGYILSGGVPYEIATPYTEAQLSRIYVTQDADVLTIVHPDHDPRTLSRITETNWVIDIINYASTLDSPSFTSFVSLTVTNITQANPAVVTVASTAGLTDGNTVYAIFNVLGMTEINGLTSKLTVLTGATFSLDDIDSTGFTAYTSGGTMYTNNPPTEGAGAGTYLKNYAYKVSTVDINGVESIPFNVISLTTTSLTTTFGIKLEWNAVAGASYYRIYKDPSNNSGVFGWIGDSKTLSFVDFNIAPIVSDAPPEDRQPFSGADNKPATVTYYQQRQLFGNTNNEPQSVYTTQTGNYVSLRTSNPARDDDAVTFTITAKQVNEIRHLIPLDSLIILTSGGEWKLTEGVDQVLTPATLGVKAQSFNGASWVPPVVINNTALYIQEKGARVRDLSYEFSSDKFAGNDLSLLAEHLFENFNIEEMAYAAEPYGILWCVRSDGTLLGLTYQREHQVWAWHQHDLGGTVESVATISEDGRDALYMTVVREIAPVNLFQNGDFSSDSGWLTSTPFSWSIASGVASLSIPSGYTSYLYQTTASSGIALTIGQTYEISFEIKSWSQGGIQIIVDGTTLPTIYSSLGAHSVQFVATTTGSVGIGFISSTAAGSSYSIDNAVIKETGIKRYIERMEMRDVSSPENTFCVDSGLTYSGTPATVISGLDHLEGRDVAVVADGNEVPGLTVSSGSITLPNAANIVHVGLPYVPAIETLDIDAPGIETVKGKAVTVSRVVMEVEKSRGGWVGPISDDDTVGEMREIKPRFQSDDYGAIALKTFKEEINSDPQWTQGGRLRIEQRSPFPLAILSIIPSVDIGS